MHILVYRAPLGHSKYAGPAYAIFGQSFQFINPIWYSSTGVTPPMNSYDVMILGVRLST